MTTKPKWAPDATPEQIKTFVATCKTIVVDGGCHSLPDCNRCPRFCKQVYLSCPLDPVDIVEEAQAYLDYYDNPEDVAFNRPPVSGPIFDDPNIESETISYLTEAEAKQIEQVNRLSAELTAASLKRNIIQVAIKAAKRKRDGVTK